MIKSFIGIRFVALSLGSVISLLFLSANAFAYLITTAHLTGPNCINCPPGGQQALYTVSLAGTGQSDILERWLNYAVYDAETSEDTLQDEIAFSILGDAQGNWNTTLQFTLECDGDCDVVGDDGGSWETEAEIYVKIENSWGLDITDTNTLKVTCGMPAPMPEPSTVLLLSSGLFGLIGISRKKMRRGEAR